MGRFTAALGLPVVGFAFVVDSLRRLPGSRIAGRVLPWIVAGLIVAAGVALVLHWSQKSPQRISMLDLATGKLSNLQSWIIISGHLVEDRTSVQGRRLYHLTDAEAPDAELLVTSKNDLVVGDVTISGNLRGSRPSGPSQGAWTGQLVADEVLAREPPPPWPAIGLALAAGLLLLVRRSAYPVFIRGRPRAASPGEATLAVKIRRSTGQPAPRTAEPATLVLKGDGAASLMVPNQRPVSLQLHSALTAVDVGILRTLGSTEPALRIHASAEDITISFASRDQRDRAVASLRA